MKNFVLTTLVFAVLGSASLTFAQVNQAGVARQLSADALAAAQAGDWEEAANLFQQSYDLAPRALTLYNLASAQLNIGRLVDADENFRRFLRETAPGQHDQFRAEAASARDGLAGRIAYVQITAEGIGEHDAIQLDGVNLSAAVMGRALPIDPGSHNVSVRRGGSVVEQEDFAATEGQTVRVALAVPTGPAISPSDAAATVNTETGETPTTASENEDGGVSPVAWVVVGVAAAAGLAVGAYFLFLKDDPEPFQSPNPIGDGLIRF